MQAILVSACLLGEKCRYDAKEKADLRILQLLKDPRFTLIPFCPECAGGLPTPRTPCERRGTSVTDANGTDRTDAYLNGAKKALELAQKHRIVCAILKERSPSCGVNEIYDGSFSGRIIPGQGVTAELLSRYRIPLFSESDGEKLDAYLQNL